MLVGSLVGECSIFLVSLKKVDVIVNFNYQIDWIESDLYLKSTLLSVSLMTWCFPLVCASSGLMDKLIRWVHNKMELLVVYFRDINILCFFPFVCFLCAME